MRKVNTSTGDCKDNFVKEEFWKRRALFYFILSILVVFIHNTGYIFYEMDGVPVSHFSKLIVDLLQKTAQQVAVPGFFVFSGIMFFRNYTEDNFKNKFTKRLQTLGIPYLLWNILGIFYTYILAKVPFFAENIRVRETLEKEKILEGIFWFKYQGVNWYIMQLLIFMILSPFIFFILKNKKIGFIFIIVSIIVYIMKINVPILIFEQFAGVYYLIGSYLGIHFWKIIYDMKRISNWYCTIFGMIVCALYFSVFSSICKSFLLDIVIVLIFIYLLWQFILWIPENKMEKISMIVLSSSFWIYETHQFLEPGINKLFYLFTPHNNVFMIINSYGTFIITLLLCISSYVFMSKKMKNLLLILTGRE